MSWNQFFNQESNKEYYLNLFNLLKTEYDTKTIYPPFDNIFESFKLCKLNDLKIVTISEMDDFYKNLDLKYPEIAITLEKFNKNSDATVLCDIPVLLPFMENSSSRIDTSNIENKNNNLGISPCTIHNGTYIKINREY